MTELHQTSISLEQRAVQESKGALGQSGRWIRFRKYHSKYTKPIKFRDLTASKYVTGTVAIITTILFSSIVGYSMYCAGTGLIDKYVERIYAPNPK